MMTNEMVRKIENLVSKFNHNHISSYDDVALMIEVNSDMLDRAVEAKIALFRILTDMEADGYVVNMTTTHDGFISKIFWSK